MLQDFRAENEEEYEKRSSELADHQCRNQRDGHGEFHRHAARKQILQSFAKDRKAARKHGGDCQQVNSFEWLNNARPTDHRGRSDHQKDDHVRPLNSGVLMCLRTLGGIGAGLDGMIGRDLHVPSVCKLSTPPAESAVTIAQPDAKTRWAGVNRPERAESAGGGFLPAHGAIWDARDLDVESGARWA